MRNCNYFRWICVLLFSYGLTSTAYSGSLEQIITGEHRSAANIARNQYRHPVETLRFFEVEPHMTVVEIWPGRGWYTEVIAPYLKGKGTFYGAHFSPRQTKPFYKNMRANYQDRLAENPKIYGNAKVTGLYPPFNDGNAAPDNSADRVLTFRNVHNWSKGGFDQAMFRVFYRILKPGGILGVVEHRAAPATKFKDMISSGYMTEAYVVQLAENAGFELVAKSEINANAKDLKNYPNGVWSLPPTLRGKDKRRPEYLQIGESDRMTLKFIKPKTE